MFVNPSSDQRCCQSMTGRLFVVEIESLVDRYRLCSQMLQARSSRLLEHCHLSHMSDAVCS